MYTKDHVVNGEMAGVEGKKKEKRTRRKVDNAKPDSWPTRLLIRFVPLLFPRSMHAQCPLPPHAHAHIHKPERRGNRENM
jgi:hypothetical protein